MKIALCSKGTFSLEIGSTKNRIELAEGLKKLGWETVLVDKNILGIPVSEKYNAYKYSMALKNYLITHSHEYDVVLYEYDTLPYDRKLFNKTTLFVARPAILSYHLLSTRFKFNLKTKVVRFCRKILDRISGEYKKSIASYKRIDYCLEQCDVIQVQNSKDRELLIKRGFPTNKIIIIPNGISAERIQKFKNDFIRNTELFTIVCIGTFDFRKGAMDFPYILKELKKKYKNINLKLLGTSGMFSTVEQVLNFFPKKFHALIQVIPKFNEKDLPQLLQGCQVGIFPSYLESFGFGALEMMCAGIPVVAYDSPGPSDFIIKDLLVSTGDKVNLTRNVLLLLGDTKLLKQKSIEAREVVVNKYCWDDIAKKADSYYKTHLFDLTKTPILTK